jgi:formylglycine-generating enzyme required for sulfatase activity
VGSFPAGASWCGAHDLAGNVWEWCADWFGPYASTPVVNPQGPASGDYRVLRGGAWSGSEGSTRGANRFYGDLVTPFIDYGFRCVSLAPAP